MPREFLGGGRKEERRGLGAEEGVSLVGFLCFSCRSSSSSDLSSRELVLRREGLIGGLNLTTLLGFVGFVEIGWWESGGGREENMEEDEEDLEGFGGGREEKTEVLGGGVVESKEGFGSEREMGFVGGGAVFSCSSSSSSSDA